MYLAVIVLPLLGSIVSGFFGRKVGVSGAQHTTSLCIIITTFIAIIIFSEVGLNSIPVSILTFRWIDSESLDVLWGFNFDSLTVSMLIPVLVVSSLVHIYSIGYMSHDPHNQRFFSYLSLFTFMMIILVTANNFLLMFVGWEGVGVCSYLLVSFWFTRIAANQSSMSAFLTNRIGDCFLTLGMFAMLWTYGNLDYSTVFSLAPFASENVVTIIGICLLIGAMAKSSQIGLHVWLPLAMEGPTPVSALIHAATMVTAGVYLLMRASPLIEYSSTVLIISLWIGSITTVFSSLIGLFQQDIKKVIAYSTMSQLGMMVIAVGLSSYSVALFHLVNHAFYKGLLFLGAGAVIHAVADNQDFRKYGGLLAFLPLTYTVMLVASLSLVAFPFMTGFYSKDFILESAFGQFQYSSIAVYFTATIGAMFTTLYSVKVLYLTFLTSANGPAVNYNKAHEGDIFMSLPLIILAIFSIFFGYITRDMFIGLASGFFGDNSLFVHPSHEVALNTEFAVPTLFKLLPMILTITLTICSLILFELLPVLVIHIKYTRIGYNIFSFFNLRFLVEYIYNRFITIYILKLGGQTTKILDKGSVEILGPYGLEKGLVTLSHNLSKLDTGVVTSYALYILIASVFYMLMPYIYLKDISVLLLIMYTLLVITSNTNVLRVHHAYTQHKVVDINNKQGKTLEHTLIKSDFFSLFEDIPIATITIGVYSSIIIVGKSMDSWFGKTSTFGRGSLDEMGHNVNQLAKSMFWPNTDSECVDVTSTTATTDADVLYTTYSNKYNLDLLGNNLCKLTGLSDLSLPIFTLSAILVIIVGIQVPGWFNNIYNAFQPPGLASSRYYLWGSPLDGYKPFYIYDNKWLLNMNTGQADSGSIHSVREFWYLLDSGGEYLTIGRDIIETINYPDYTRNVIDTIHWESFIQRGILHYCNIDFSHITIVNGDYDPLNNMIEQLKDAIVPGIQQYIQDYNNNRAPMQLDINEVNFNHGIWDWDLGYLADLGWGCMLFLLYFVG